MTTTTVARLAMRSVLAGITVAVVAVVMAMARTEDFPCHLYMSDGIGFEHVNAGPREMGCLFQSHVNKKTSATVSQEGRLRRDTDTFVWSWFATSFAANPSTPYLYTTLPLFSLDVRWWPFGRASFLPSPMWRFRDPSDAAVLVGRLPPETVYTGLTTFALWKPFRFVFASLGDSSNGITLKFDPETRRFAYVICFADTTRAAGASDPKPPSAYGAVMEALVASGLPEEAINVQLLDPELLPSRWTYYELVLRIFEFRNQTEGGIYLQRHNHDHPFYYVSAGNSRASDDSKTEGSTQQSSSTIPKQWSVPTNATGFKETFHPKSINERTQLTSSFDQYGREVLSDLHRILSTTSASKNTVYDGLEGQITRGVYNSTYIHTNHSFGPLDVAQGTNCLRNNTECLGGCPDANYFGLNVGTVTNVDNPLLFEALPSWPTTEELHVVTMTDHRAFNNSVYGSMALLWSSSRFLDPYYLTRNVQATSVSVTSLDLWGNEPNRPGVGETKEKNSSVFAAWVFTRNPDHCRILSIAQSSSQHPRRYGCSVIDNSRHLLPSHRYVTYLERIYLNPLTGTRPDFESVLPARLYRLFLGDPGSEINSNESKSPSSSLSNGRYGPTTDSKSHLPFSQIRLPPSQKLITFDGKQPLRFLHTIKTGGESLENYIWREPSLKIDYGACWKAAARAKNSSLSFFRNATVRGRFCDALATFTSSTLCGLNCECCASDIFARDHGNANSLHKAFHGTLLRSPRAHVLSQFSHCHAAHHSTWGRIFGDVPLYAAEAVLRLTETACQSSCDVRGDPDWFRALQTRLDNDERDIPAQCDSYSEKSGDSCGSIKNSTDRVLVISIHNTQSHALTCGKARGSFGHHFKRITSKHSEGTSNAHAFQAPDEYTPSLQDAISALEKFEWFGITELFVPSLCLLHYQANRRLPPSCDCDSPAFVEHDHPDALGYWKETRSKKRRMEDLTEEMLGKIDDHTRIDATVYTHAVRIFLGRLRSVEEATGTSLLKCIQWDKFRAQTGYLEDLWTTTAHTDGLLV